LCYFFGVPQGPEKDRGKQRKPHCRESCGQSHASDTPLQKAMKLRLLKIKIAKTQQFCTRLRRCLRRTFTWHKNMGLSTRAGMCVSSHAYERMLACIAIQHSKHGRIHAREYVCTRDRQRDRHESVHHTGSTVTSLGHTIPVRLDDPWRSPSTCTRTPCGR
jgi:hypothetical protein